MIDKDGWVVNPKVIAMRRPHLAHGKMTHISGIIVHQTGAKTAQSTLDSYLNAGANGAHFLIDKDGTIYQTGSVFWQQWHVGKLQVRCLAEMTCKPVEVKALAKMSYKAIHHHEMAKAVPSATHRTSIPSGSNWWAERLEMEKSRHMRRLHRNRTQRSRGS
jgi:hypothetical protein